MAPPAAWFKRILLISRQSHCRTSVVIIVSRRHRMYAACFERPLNLFEHNTISGWDNAAMAVTLTLAASSRPSIPTEHPGKISSGPTTLSGVPGITGHTICRTLNRHRIDRTNGFLSISSERHCQSGVNAIAQVTENNPAQCGA